MTRLRSNPVTRLGTLLAGIAPELRLLGLVVGGLLVLGTLMGFDLPGR